MTQSLQMTVLIDNAARGRGLRAEHGLSLWVEADGTNILFDTGQGLVLAANADALGVDLPTANAVVLSHGHYDHTGGLPEVLGLLEQATVYIHPRAFEPKFGRYPDGVGRDIGAPIHDLADIRSHVAQVTTTAGPTQIADGIWVTGEVPRRNDFEDTGGPFFLDQPCTQPDLLIDDQAMYVETAGGTVVFMGCAHAGLVNTLDYISELTAGRNVHAVFGGFHLARASDDRMARTIEALRRYNVQQLGPAHCTGFAASARLLEAFPDRFVTFGTGVQVDCTPPK